MLIKSQCEEKVGCPTWKQQTFLWNMIDLFNVWKGVGFLGGCFVIIIIDNNKMYTEKIIQ